MILGRLAREGRHALSAGARHGLIGRNAHPCEPCRLVQRTQDAGKRDRAAVGVRDDAVPAERLERAVAVDLRDDERVAVHEAVRGRLVDAERAACRGEGDERPTRRGPDGEQEQVHVSGAQRLGRRLLHDQLAVAERHPGSDRAGGRESTHVLVPALGEQRERDRADRTGRAYHADPRADAHAHLF